MENHLDPWTAIVGKIFWITWEKKALPPSVCRFCYSDEENIYHLFLHCHFCLEIWSAMLEEFNMKWIIPRDLISLVSGSRSRVFSKIGRDIWSLVLTSVMWALWLDRNSRVFNNYADPSFRVFLRAKEFVLLWARSCKNCHDIRSDMWINDWDRLIGI